MAQIKQFKNVEDQELIRMILANDHDALGALYQRYFRKAFATCSAIAHDRDEAFDLTEDALFKAFENLSSFRSESSFSTWLYIITHRHCLEAQRRKKRELQNKIKYSRRISEDLSSQITTPGSGDMDRFDEMLTLIGLLPRKERELLILKYAKGDSIAKLQQMFQLSQGAIKMRLTRSRQKLRHMLLMT